MDDGAVIDFIDFGNGTNVAGAEEISFLCVLTLENEWPRSFDSTLIVVDVNYIVLLECALMHTEDADFANEGVVDDFEDLSNERQILIWVGFEWRAIAFDEQRIICLCRTRQMANDYFHEITNTDQFLRGAEADRNDVSFTQCLGDERVEGARVNAAFLQITLEHFIVFLNDAFNESTVHIINRHDVAVAVFAVKTVNNMRTVACREINRQHPRSPGFLKFTQTFSRSASGSSM